MEATLHTEEITTITKLTDYTLTFTYAFALPNLHLDLKNPPPYSS